MCKNVEGIENIIPINVGLWKKECNLQVKDIGLGTSGFIIEEVETQSGLKAESINSLIKKYNIDFIDILKIDIEGSEKEVFENSDEWLNKVGMLIIELHDRMKEGCSKALFDAIIRNKCNYSFDISGENLIFYFQHKN